MTSETMNRDRRSAKLAAVIGTVLATYAGSAAAIEFEFDNGGKLNWNTTVSVGSSWRAEDPSRELYTRADGSLIGLYSAPLIPGTPVGPQDGLAGNHAAGDGNLNYAKGDRFSTPFKVLTDLEYKNGRFGALIRAKDWYDQALNQENVRVGSQANNFNGVRPGLGPVPGYSVCTAATPPGAACFPMSPAGQNLWPKGKLSDRGFEAEQQFDNCHAARRLRLWFVRHRRLRPAGASRQPGDQLGREHLHPGRQPDQSDRRPRRTSRRRRTQGNPAAGLGHLRQLGLQLRLLRGLLPAAVEQHVGRRLRHVLHGDQHADRRGPRFVRQHHRRRRPERQPGDGHRFADRAAVRLATLAAGRQQVPTSRPSRAASRATPASSAWPSVSRST